MCRCVFLSSDYAVGTGPSRSVIWIWCRSFTFFEEAGYKEGRLKEHGSTYHVSMAFSGVRLVTVWLTTIKNAMAFHPIVRIRVSASALNTKILIRSMCPMWWGF
jgi:hypothetical protein